MSVHLVVALEWIFGVVMGFYCLMFVVFGFYGIIHLRLSRILTSFGVAVVMGAIAWILFAAGLGLRRGRDWARKASWGVGVFVMFLGVWSIHERHVKIHAPNDYSGLIVGLFLIGCAVFGMVLLLLPQTREYLRSPSADSGEALL